MSHENLIPNPSKGETTVNNEIDAKVEGLKDKYNELAGGKLENLKGLSTMFELLMGKTVIINDKELKLNLNNDEIEERLELLGSFAEDPSNWDVCHRIWKLAGYDWKQRDGLQEVPIKTGLFEDSQRGVSGVHEGIDNDITELYRFINPHTTTGEKVNPD